MRLPRAEPKRSGRELVRGRTRATSASSTRPAAPATSCSTASTFCLTIYEEAWAAEASSALTAGDATGRTLADDYPDLASLRRADAGAHPRAQPPRRRHRPARRADRRARTLAARPAGVEGRSAFGAGAAARAPHARRRGRADAGRHRARRGLRRASDAVHSLKKYLPAFQQVLVGYPQATVPGMSENFHWLAYDMDGKPTYVLTHLMSAPSGVAAAVVERQ